MFKKVILPFVTRICDQSWFTRDSHWVLQLKTFNFIMWGFHCQIPANLMGWLYDNLFSSYAYPAHRLAYAGSSIQQHWSSRVMLLPRCCYVTCAVLRCEWYFINAHIAPSSRFTATNFDFLFKFFLKKITNPNANTC